MISQILSLFGGTGAMVAIDNFPPFVLMFEIKPEKYDDDFSAEFYHVTYPGGRYQYPIFKGCSPRTISFTLRFDISRRMGIAQIATQMAVESGVPLRSPEKTVPVIFTDENYKGTNSLKNIISKMIGLDYISRVRSIIEKLKMPKTGLSEVVQNAVGNILKVSQGTSEPSPPLVLLIRNINKMYLGYLSEGKIRELKYDNQMMCTRMAVDCKFLVSPDLIFTTFEDALRELNIWVSGYTAAGG